MTARDAAGRRHTSSVGVTVRPAPAIPVAITASPAAPVAERPVTFTVEVSPPAGAPAVRNVTIDFGDDSGVSLGALTGRRSVAHLYERAGSGDYVVDYPRTWRGSCFQAGRHQTRQWPVMGASVA